MQSAATTGGGRPRVTPWTAPGPVRPAEPALTGPSATTRASTRLFLDRRGRNLEPAHGAALGVQHDEIEPGQHVMLAALGHMPHLVCNEAADGIEVLEIVGRRERDAESFAHPLDGGFAADTIGAVGQPEDVALVFGDVEFVLDLADDLLEHVLDGDEAGKASELIDH